MTDAEILMVAEETIILLVERMVENPLYDPECDCMTHYCKCEHEGWIQAVAYLEDCVTGVK